MQHGIAVIAHAAQNAAVPAGGDIATRSRVDLHDLARGEELLLLQHDHAGAVAPLLIGPNTRGNVFDRVGDVSWAVIAVLALRPLRGVAANRNGGVDEKVEPVSHLFDLRTALRIDGAVILSAVENPPRGVGQACQRRSRRRFAEVIGLVGEEIFVSGLGWNIAVTDIGALRRRQALGVAGGRQHTIKVDVSERGDQVADAGCSDGEAVDLFEAPRAVGKKALPRLRGIGTRFAAFLFPGLTIGLQRHVGKRVKTVLGQKLDLEHRLVVGAGSFLVKHALAVDIAVGRPVELGGVGFERVRGKALDVNGHRRGQPLRAENVETLLTPIRILAQRQAVFAARFVGGHERRRVLNGGRRTGEVGDFDPGLCGWRLG